MESLLFELIVKRQNVKDFFLGWIIIHFDENKFVYSKIGIMM